MCGGSGVVEGWGRGKGEGEGGRVADVDGCDWEGSWIGEGERRRLGRRKEVNSYQRYLFSNRIGI